MLTEAWHMIVTSQQLYGNKELIDILAFDIFADKKKKKKMQPDLFEDVRHFDVGAKKQLYAFSSKSIFRVSIILSPSHHLLQLCHYYSITHSFTWHP